MQPLVCVFVALLGFSLAQERDADICKMPLVTGRCRAAFRMYGFDSSRGVCRQFIYGGCGGNNNKFRTQSECEAKCGEDVDVCKMPITSGPCEAYMPSWGFDSTVNGCREFGYGGCMGNGNRFSTKEECTKRCPGNQ